MAKEKYEPLMNDQYDSPFIDAVLDEMRNAFAIEDLEAIDELLRFIPRINLVQYLPEEEWEKWMSKEELADIYAGKSKRQ